MKKVIFVLLSILTTIFTNTAVAQCDTQFPCVNPIEVSSLSNVDTLNKVNNQQGNKCFVGNGLIKPDVNWNNWNMLTFLGDQEIWQVINVNPGQRVYMKGDIFISRITFAGTADKAVLRIGDGSIVNIDEIVANNTYNYIIVSKTSKVFYRQNEVSPGDTILLQGNETNIVSIRLCTGSISAKATRKR